jgi:hypothetical protein
MSSKDMPQTYLLLGRTQPCPSRRGASCLNAVDTSEFVELILDGLQGVSVLDKRLVREQVIRSGLSPKSFSQLLEENWFEMVSEKTSLDASVVKQVVDVVSALLSDDSKAMPHHLIRMKPRDVAAKVTEGALEHWREALALSEVDGFVLSRCSREEIDEFLDDVDGLNTDRNARNRILDSLLMLKQTISGKLFKNKPAAIALNDSASATQPVVHATSAELQTASAAPVQGKDGVGAHSIAPVELENSVAPIEHSIAPIELEVRESSPCRVEDVGCGSEVLAGVSFDQKSGLPRLQCLQSPLHCAWLCSLILAYFFQCLSFKEV